MLLIYIGAAVLLIGVIFGILFALSRCGSERQALLSAPPTLWRTLPDEMCTASKL